MTLPKVLMFGWELPPHNSGGLGVACYGLTKGLSDLGAKITFILPKKLEVNAPFMEVKFDRLPLVNAVAVNSLLQAYMTAWGYRKIIVNGKELDLTTMGDTIYEEAIRFGNVASQWASHLDHDLIHVHDWMTYPAGRAASSVSGNPWVAHVHATEYDRAGDRPDTRIAQIEYEGLNNADRVICVSDLTKRTVMRKYGIKGDKIDIVYNGVSMDDFPRVDTHDLLPNSKVVLFLGRLTMQKGLEYFLQAAKRVLEYEPKAVFVIAGSGDLEQQLILQASLLGIGDKVIFTGFIRNPLQRASLFQRADVFVMPSVSEPFGLVALEALANQKPVIMSYESGVAEVIKHALKAHFWDTNELANMMVSVLRHKELGNELASGGYREMQKLSWNEAANRTMDVYNKLVIRNGVY